MFQLVPAQCVLSARTEYIFQLLERVFVIQVMENRGQSVLGLPNACLTHIVSWKTPNCWEKAEIWYYKAQNIRNITDTEKTTLHLTVLELGIFFCFLDVACGSLIQPSGTR